MENTAPVLHVLRKSPDAVLPHRAHPTDAGLDITAIEDIVLHPNEHYVMQTGWVVAIPKGHLGLVADRSSLALKGVKTVGGVIDQDYRGELGVIFWNMSKGDVQLRKGERVAQLLIMPFCLAQPIEVQVLLDDTVRGSGGFGSSGK